MDRILVVYICKFLQCVIKIFEWICNIVNPFKFYFLDFSFLAAFHAARAPFVDHYKLVE